MVLKLQLFATHYKQDDEIEILDDPNPSRVLLQFCERPSGKQVSYPPQHRGGDRQLESRHGVRSSFPFGGSRQGQRESPSERHGAGRDPRGRCQGRGGRSCRPPVPERLILGTHPGERSRGP